MLLLGAAPQHSVSSRGENQRARPKLREWRVLIVVVVSPSIQHGNTGVVTGRLRAAQPSPSAHSPSPLIERLLNPLSRVGWLSKFESRERGSARALAGTCQPGRPAACRLVTWLVIQALPCPATRIRVHKHTSERAILAKEYLYL